MIGLEIEFEDKNGRAYTEKYKIKDGEGADLLIGSITTDLINANDGTIIKDTCMIFDF